MHDSEATGSPAPAGDSPAPPGGLFTTERRAFLEPRLRALIEELRLLDALVTSPASEPAFTPRDGYVEARDAD